MKKAFMVLFLLTFIFTAVSAADAVTVTAQEAQAAPLTGTVKSNNFIDDIFNLFAPSKTSATASAEIKPDATSIYDDGDGFTLLQKLLVAGDIFASAYCAVSWVTFLQGLSDYNEAYVSVNNTSYNNYLMLLSGRKEVLNRETTAWVSSGVAAALLLYTAADLIWLHAVFPVEPGYVYRNNTHILALNCRF